jgi:predicted GNAT superfamily acetyltransferase
VDENTNEKTGLVEDPGKKSIDELLAEERAKWEAKIAAENAEKAKLQPEKPKKYDTPKAKAKRLSKNMPGDVAHTHKQVNEDFEEYEKECKYVLHAINDAKGFVINEHRYQGNVVVPQCVADYLSMMESRMQITERGMFQDRGRRLYQGEIRG